MPKLMKRRMADEVRKLLEGVDDVLVVGLEPMDTERNLELRNRIRGEGGRLRVVHNRTARFGLEKRLEGLGPWLRGQTALALGREAIPLARALVEAAQLNLVRVRGGLVEGELLDAAGVRALAAIP
ncbi:MAG: 50S ribosomal protein L10, partial [Planctomycetota bacterium]